MKKAPARIARSIKLSVSKLFISWRSSSYSTLALRSLSEVRSMLSVSVILAQKTQVGLSLLCLMSVTAVLQQATSLQVSLGVCSPLRVSCRSSYSLVKRFDVWSCTPALGQQKGALPYTHTILNQLTGFLIARRETGACFIRITRDWVRISIYSQLSSSIWANSCKGCSSSCGSCLL